MLGKYFRFNASIQKPVIAYQREDQREAKY